MPQTREVLAELEKIGTIETVYFEGGEPFLFYALLLEGVRDARERGFQVGIVTNAYWARSVEDAVVWLRPFADLGIADFSISDDALHDMNEGIEPARNAQAAAEKLGMSAATICIEKPVMVTQQGDSRGEPIVGGDVVFRGRAVDKLGSGMRTQSLTAFTECKDEELRNPGRVHLDAYGHVHICQGISMGNMWQTSLSELVASYEADAHPICGPLLRGGPAGLAREHGLASDGEHISACHACFALRRALRDRFPEHLAPPQIYGA
jgi:hypothetical protein